MSSKKFEKIVERNIEQFVGHFSDDSSVIYKDEKDKLIQEAVIATRDYSLNTIKNCTKISPKSPQIVKHTVK